MKVTLLANAGILVEGAGLHLLVDGIHGRTHRFSAVPEDMLSQIVEGEGEFAHIAYALLTHNHADHYNEEHTREFLLAHRCTELIAPLLIPGIPSFRQIRVAGSGGSISLPQAQVDYVRIAHEGEEYSSVLNYGYRVTLGDESFIVLGDAAVADVPRALEELTAAGPVDAIFVNFPMITLGSGREALSECEAKEIFVFHLPFEEDDTENYRSSCEKMLPRARAVLGVPITILEQPAQVEETGKAI